MSFKFNMALVHIYNRQNRRNPRLFKKRLILETLRDFEILSRYRLDRQSILLLTDLLKTDLQRGTLRSESVSPETQVLIALRFIAKGSFYSELADIHGVSRSTVCVTLDAVINAVNKNLDNIKSCGLPNVVGAVDGTMIPIQAPVDNEHVYVCRKGYHAINVQAVVDSKMRDINHFFTDKVASLASTENSKGRCPTDSSCFDFFRFLDVTYLEQSNVGYLLGDSGYPLRGYLMTPLLNPASSAEQKYNAQQSTGRQVVEKAFGVLKSRFRCLPKSGGHLLFNATKCCKTVTACMRLHNFCQTRNVPLIDPIVLDDNCSVQQGQQVSDSTGRDRQRELIQFLQRDHQ